MPVEAAQDSAIDEAAAVAVGVPGLPGTVGVLTPPQDAPLSVQFAGTAEPGAAMNPNVTEAPGAIVAFQPRLVNVNRWPLRDIAASQEEVTAAPEGRSKATDQPLIAVAPPLLIV